MNRQAESPRDPTPHMAQIVERNIQALLDKRLQEENNRGFQERMAAIITRFTGSMLFVYIHLVCFGLWIVINLGWTPIPRFDPTFVVLAMFASVEAIFLSTFVLITQNRMQALADRRADLDLQISLLAEHEVTQLIHMVSALSERLDVGTSEPRDLHELKQDVRPEHVLDKIHESEQQLKTKR